MRHHADKETSQTNIRFGYKVGTVSRKFMEILNQSELKDSYHTIKDLGVKTTFQQTESDNGTLSDIYV